MSFINIYQYALIAYASIVFLLMFLENLKTADFQLDKHWQFNNWLIVIYSILGILLKLGLIASPSFSMMQFGFVFREVGIVQPTKVLGSLFLVLLPFLFIFKDVRLSRIFSIILAILLLNSIFHFKEMLLQFSNQIKTTHTTYGIHLMDCQSAFYVVGFSTICWIGFFFYLDRIEEVETNMN